MFCKHNVLKNACSDCLRDRIKLLCEVANAARVVHFCMTNESIQLDDDVQRDVIMAGLGVALDAYDADVAKLEGGN